MVKRISYTGGVAIMQTRLFSICKDSKLFCTFANMEIIVSKEIEQVCPDFVGACVEATVKNLSLIHI